MVKIMSGVIAHPHTYQQALDDFGITELLSYLSNYSDADFDAAWMNLENQERHSLAAILVQQLTNSLKGKLIASCLNAIRQGGSDVLSGLISIEIPPQSIDLPANFPDVKTPRCLYGDKLRWISSEGEIDWGIAIGRFYSFAPHRYCWMWCYVLWLSKDSPSAAWKVTDTALEEELNRDALEDYE